MRRDRAAAVALVAAGYGVGAGDLGDHPQPRLGGARLPWHLRPGDRPAGGRLRPARLGGGAEPFHGRRGGGRPPDAGSRRRSGLATVAAGGPGSHRVRRLGHHGPGQQLRVPLRAGRRPSGRLRDRPHGRRRPGSPARRALWPGAGWPTTSGGGPRRRCAWSHGALRRAGTYSGSRPALVAGYMLARVRRSVLAPAWARMLDGAVPDLGAGLGDRVVDRGRRPGRGRRARRVRCRGRCGNRFAAAADMVFLPGAAAALFWLLPETKGREPEALWPAR